MRKKILIVFVLLILQLVQMYGQYVNPSIGWDSTYTELKANRLDVINTLRGISENRAFSKRVRTKIKGAIEKESLQQLESIVYYFFNLKWCDESTKFANQILKLNISQLSTWILKEASLNNKNVNTEGVTKLCFDNKLMSIVEYQEVFENQKYDIDKAIQMLVLSPVIGKDILKNIQNLDKPTWTAIKYFLANVYFNNEDFKRCEEVLISIIEEEILFLNKPNPISKNGGCSIYCIELLKEINLEKANGYLTEIEILYRRGLEHYKSNRFRRETMFIGVSEINALQRKNCP